jgi:hypothetical protein
MKRHQLIITTAILIATMTAAVADELVRFEGEHFGLTHNIGLENIQILTGSSCSGGYMLYGLDYPGEWVEYNQVHIDTLGYYVPRARIMGEYQARYEIQLTFTPCLGGDSETSVITVFGSGFG